MARSPRGGLSRLGLIDLFTERLETLKPSLAVVASTCQYEEVTGHYVALGVTPMQHNNRRIRSMVEEARRLSGVDCFNICNDPKALEALLESARILAEEEGTEGARERYENLRRELVGK